MKMVRLVLLALWCLVATEASVLRMTQDRHCEKLAHALWNYVREQDAYDDRMEQTVKYHYKYRLQKYWHVEDLPGARKLACQLIDIPIINETNLWKILPVNYRPMLDLGRYAEAVPTLEPVKRIHAGIRRLGYPMWPLPASRQEVQDYLDDVELAALQIPGCVEEPTSHTRSWKFSDLTDDYLEAQNEDQLVTRLNNKYANNTMVRWPLLAAEYVKLVGWPLIEAEHELGKELLATGVYKEIVAYEEEMNRKYKLRYKYN